MTTIRNLSHLPRLAWRQLARHRWRSALTLLGIASGVFLLATVESARQSLARATAAAAADSTLVVYQAQRFCPSTSRLPEHYLGPISRLPGVRDVTPVLIVVNHCGASLDVVAFRGVDADAWRTYLGTQATIEGGSFDEWLTQSDGALVGAHLARSRGLKPGDRFEAAGVIVTVSGILDSPNSQDNSVAYTHLPFLQQASGTGLGTVTQFNVRADPETATPTEVAREIDALFSSDQIRTNTSAEAAFFADTAADMIELVGFTRWLALAAVVAVAGLIANTMLLVVRGRLRESALLHTLGFSGGQIGGIVLFEGLLLGVLGGLLGIAAAAVLLAWQAPTFGSEGVVMAVALAPGDILRVLAAATALAIAASLYPALLASRRCAAAALRL